MDIITHLPVTEWGCDTIATLVDHMSKYVYFVPCKSMISAEELAQLFIATVCRGMVCLSRSYLIVTANTLVGFGSL